MSINSQIGKIKDYDNKKELQEEILEFSRPTTTPSPSIIVKSLTPS